MKLRLALALASLSAAPVIAAPGTLAVDVDKPGVKISPMLYGIFFEEINNAGDGGLYAELLRNRNFEESAQPEHWKLLLGGNARGRVAIGERRGAEATEFNKRHLTITWEASAGPQAPGDRVGAVCDGYWGVPATLDGSTLTLRWRSNDRVMPVVTLEGKSGAVYSTGELSKDSTAPASEGWRTLTYTFSKLAAGGDPTARLVISLDRPGSIDVDFVSLMRPSTFVGERPASTPRSTPPSPVRQDLVERLVALNPAFMRFPGGCWVEGETMANAYRWKRTLGPLWERWTQPNLWGYQSPNGLGYHEYLQLCEDLGASAMFVANVGMSHRDVVPMDQMGPWVQDALDAIEYAIGDESTEWGKRRAAAGHPAPFDLRYVEIGNENGGPAYDERYALFYDAIKAKHPQVRTIACDWQGRPKSRPIEILDEHYYKTPQWFFQRQAMYDTYDRKGFKVYVGEYAVTQGAGGGNLIAALGEAAFMTGMERNADIVEMASYAPLFTHVDGKRWNPDLINFDSTRSYGTPSYHVQTMFAANRGDVVLPLRVERPETTTAPADEKRNGAAGVATWSTQAEYKDFEVVSPDGRTLYKADLGSSNEAARWKFNTAGRWAVREGVLGQTGNATDSTATVGEVAWSDYSVRVKARKVGGAEGFIVAARRQDDGNYIWFNVGGWGNNGAAIERAREGDKEEITPRADFKVETGRWYDLRLDVKGDEVVGYVDGKVVARGKDLAQPTQMFAAGATRDVKTGDIILKVVNGTGEPQDMNVKLNGVTALKGKPTAMVMAGQPRDENTLDAPRHVAPVTAEVDANGPNFAHAFPAHSVTVIRVPAQ